jgi:hypothetical protein
MFRKFLERLRGSSRAPDDLATGTTRPGDFAEQPAEALEHGAPLDPNPRDVDEAEGAE